MNLYTKIFISIFIIFPYFIIATEFYSEFNLIFPKILHKEPNKFTFKLIFSSYFTLYFICLIFGFCEIIIFDIISGLITLFSSAIFYKPFTIERKNYLDYFPHLEVIYVFFVGIYFIVHGIILIVRKIKNRKYFVHMNEENINIMDGSLLNDLDKPKHYIKIKNISFEISKASLKEGFYYLLNQKIYILTKKKINVFNFSKDDFDFEFDNNSLILGIKQITLKIKNEYVTLKKFKGQVNFDGTKIKIKILEKGTISHEISFFKNVFLKVGYNLFKGIAVDKVENKINKKIKNGINVKKEIFDINIFFQEFSINNDILKIVFNISVDINLKNMISK